MRIDKKKLEFAMARACISTSDLLKASEIPRTTMNGAVNTGRNVRPATAGKIAKALGVDVIDILED